MDSHIAMSLRQIFDILFGNQLFPEATIDFLYDNLKSGKWHLTAVPFRPLNCQRVRVNERGDNYACGYWQNNTLIGFNERSLRGGDHYNLHNIIHCLCDLGVHRANIKLEQWFKGYRTDVLAEIDKKYIIVELGSLSSFQKFRFVEDEIVKAFWFGDKDKFVYSLSRREEN